MDLSIFENSTNQNQLLSEEAIQSVSSIYTVFLVAYDCSSNCSKMDTNIAYGLRHLKTCLWAFANNKDADPPAHPHRLIGTFVICFFESIMSKLATSEISIF